MYREIISIIIIIVLVVSMDIITGNYTKDTVESITNSLSQMRDITFKLKYEEENDNEINNFTYEDAKGEIGGIYENWRSRYKLLSYYLEHDELEKVEADITNIKSYIEVKDFDMTIQEIDSCMYVLNHIEDKEKLSLSNIF